jgi:hypothetical protein
VKDIEKAIWRPIGIANPAALQAIIANQPAPRFVNEPDKHAFNMVELNSRANISGSFHDRSK